MCSRIRCSRNTKYKKMDKSLKELVCFLCYIILCAQQVNAQQPHKMPKPVDICFYIFNTTQVYKKHIYSLNIIEDKYKVSLHFISV